MKIKNIYLKYRFIIDFITFKKHDVSRRFTINFRDRLPQLHDKTTMTPFDAHYIYHPAWAARILAKTRPEKHIDISSILSFSTIISAFIPTEFYDYRPANIQLTNLKSGSINLLSLPFETDSVSSISCMHTIEHIGLGRYGDLIDPEADLKAISELKRVVKINGDLLFVVPIGKPKISFNAHRIYSYDQIISYFSNFRLENFFMIPDNSTNGESINNSTKEVADKQNYACGCFWFKKNIYEHKIKN